MWGVRVASGCGCGLRLLYHTACNTCCASKSFCALQTTRPLASSPCWMAKDLSQCGKRKRGNFSEESMANPAFSAFLSVCGVGCLLRALSSSGG